MARARISRIGVEVVGNAPVTAAAWRQSVQVAASSTAANSGASVFASRVGVEVVADAPVTASVFRQSMQVAVSGDAANAGAAARVSRVGVEVLATISGLAGVSRQSLQVAAKSVFANTAAAARVSRVAFEVVADAPESITARDLPEGFSVRLHDWTAPFKMESAYSTSIQQSETGAEKRRGLSGKPYRTVTAVWTGTSRSESAAMDALTKRMCDARTAMPIYADQTPLTQTVGATATTTIYCDTTLRRFVIGGWVAIVEVDGRGHATGNCEFRKVASRASDSLELTSTVSSMSKGRWLVIPLLNCDQALEVSREHVTGDLMQSTIEVQESVGESAYPVSATGIPDGVNFYGSMPIWPFDPNYRSTVKHDLSRDGAIEPVGRGRVVNATADRTRAVGGGSFLLQRADFWTALQFFDSRRGRLAPFLVIDQDSTARVAIVSDVGTYVDFTPGDDIDAFSEDLEYLGLVMKDGTRYARPVLSVVETFGVWRVTLEESLPAGLVVSDIRRAARARVCRMLNDAFVELWQTTTLCQVQLSFFELLREQEFAA